MIPAPTSDMQQRFFSRFRLWIIASGIVILSVILTLVAVNAPKQSSNTTELIALATANPTAAIDMASAWGPQLKLAEVPATIDNDHVFVLETVTPDGKYLLGTIYPRDLAKEAGRLVLLDIQSRQIKEIRQLSQPGIRVRGADVDAEWIAWMEVSYPEPEVYGWDIYAYNRNSGDVKRLTGEPAPQFCAGCGTEIYFSAVAHGTVIWYGMSYGSRPPSTSYWANSTDLTTGITSRLTEVKGPPGVSWPYVAWEEVTRHLDRLNAGLPENIDSSFKLLNMETGELRTFPNSQNEYLHTMYGGTLLWKKNSGEIFTTNHEKAQATAILKADELFPTQMNDRLIILAGIDTYKHTLFAWDRAQPRLVRVIDGLDKPVGAKVKDGILVWIVGSSINTFVPGSDIIDVVLPVDQTIYVLDTSTLPGISP